uniref:Uncharacterized protein n=1 Tax=Setaria viridis TaxID=4556 RepID=A0A4U6UGY4_SETVI|nr:hypothetical protein SEVIR_5G238033v2 [Setaria viridis]
MRRLGSYLKPPCSFLYQCKLQTASVTHSHSHMAIPFDLNELPVEDEDSQRVEAADELDDDFQQVEDADELDEDFRQVEDVDELDDLPVENGNRFDLNLPLDEFGAVDLDFVQNLAEHAVEAPVEEPHRRMKQMSEELRK